MIKFECHAKRPDGERLYRLIIDNKVVREGLTIDDVVEAINDRDEARLGMDHAPKRGGWDDGEGGVKRCTTGSPTAPSADSGK